MKKILTIGKVGKGNFDIVYSSRGIIPPVLKAFGCGGGAKYKILVYEEQGDNADRQPR